jgi:hypothetical protein
MALPAGVKEMIMSKAHTPSTRAYTSWMDWIRRPESLRMESGPSNWVHAEELPDHMLRDIGILDGRDSKGYRPRRSIDGLLNDSINGKL